MLFCALYYVLNKVIFVLYLQNTESPQLSLPEHVQKNYIKYSGSKFWNHCVSKAIDDCWAFDVLGGALTLSSTCVVFLDVS